MPTLKPQTGVVFQFLGTSLTSGFKFFNERYLCIGWINKIIQTAEFVKSLFFFWLSSENFAFDIDIMGPKCRFQFSNSLRKKAY